MNPHTKIFAGVRVNGIATDWGHIELRYVPANLARFILDSDMDAREFSSMELRLSKRQIVWGESKLSEEERFLSGLPIEEIDGSDPIDEVGDITHEELLKLSSDPIWTQFTALKFNAENFTASEADLIRKRWEATYGETKYSRLIKRE